MIDYLNDLFKSNEKFRLEQQSILENVEDNCSKLKQLADSLPDGEQKNQLIDETNKLHQSVKEFQAELV